MSQLVGPISPIGPPHLGLVCITSSEVVRFRALTRKRLLLQSPTDQVTTLRRLYADNLARLDKAISYCAEKNIYLYRLSSSLFPFADEPVGAQVLEELTAGLRLVGGRATALGIRLVLHPDQFVVLSSDSPAVIDTSIKILRMHAWIMDMLAQPRSPWAAMQLHGGKSNRSDRLVTVIQSLPEPIRTRLVLENDEHAYGAPEILDVCQRAGVPMVFDAHHHVCREKLASYDHPSIAEFLGAARQTWPVPEWQLVHISNGRGSLTDPHHSDLIQVMPEAYREVEWIEVEAKLKEQAIEKVRAEWLGSPTRTEGGWTKKSPTEWERQL